MTKAIKGVPLALLLGALFAAAAKAQILLKETASMMRTMRWLVFAVIAAAFACKPGQAATYTAASCSESDVSSAVASEHASPVDGDIIAIPACSGGVSWTTQLATTFSNSVTIQGAGALSATTGGASTTGTDQTVIIDGYSSNNPLLALTTRAGKSLEITGIAILQNSSSIVKYNGMLSIYGPSTAVRVDHCHFYSYISGNKPIAVWDAVLGVADHDFFDAQPGIVTNDITVLNGGSWNGASDGLGNESWADTDHFGTSEFFYAEDDNFNYGWTTDCSNGGRFVIRHSTGNHVTDTEEHGTHNQYRGCRTIEFYLNTFTGDSTTAYAPIFSLNAGAGLLWGNTVATYDSVVQLDIIRQSNGTYSQSAPPNGWGYCGTGQTGVSSSWDQNTNSTGYACLDAPGRGAGDLLTGSNFPSIVNSTTGTQTWPHQALDPIYVWGNTYSNGGYSSTKDGIIIDGTGGNLADNRDYYQQFGTYGESGSFNGTKGVGQGLYSVIPSTCTAGPGGNTPGVGYWATDQNTLYVCNPTNKWTAYYTPYTYPHPLTQTTPSPPTNLRAVAH